MNNFPDSIAELVDQTLLEMQRGKLDLEEQISELKDEIEEGVKNLDEYEEKLDDLVFLMEEYNTEAEDLGL